MLLPSVRIGINTHLKMMKLMAPRTSTRTAVRRGFWPKTNRRMALKPLESEFKCRDQPHERSLLSEVMQRVYGLIPA